MSVTATLDKAKQTVHGNLRRNVLTLAFDDSYPDGGESISARALGLKVVEAVQVIGGPQGYSYEYDYAANKLKVYQQSPFVIIEDTGAFTAGVAYTLKHRPAYIVGMRGTAGSTGSKRLIPNGETVGAGNCKVNFTTGVITWGDAAITRAIIMYVPLGVPGFTENLLVVDESITLADATGGVGLGTVANRAALLQYCWNNEDNEVTSYAPVGEAAGANQVTVDLDASGATEIRVLTSDIGNGADKLTVTYLKYDTAIHTRLLRWRDQLDITMATTTLAGPGSGTSAAATALDAPSLFIPGYGPQWVGEIADNTNKAGTLVDPDGTAAAGVGLWNPWTNEFSFHSDDALTRIEMPGVYVPAELAGGVMLEVGHGSNLAALSGVKVIAEGY